MKRGVTAALVAAALTLLLALPKRSDEDDSVRVAKAFLVELEGVVLKVYDDGAGYDTVGIGHRWKKGEPVPLTVADAISLLDTDVKKHLPCIEKYRDRLEPWQFASLIAFVFNVGCTKFNLPSCSVRNLLDAGLFDSVPDAMMRYNKSRNKATGKLEFNQGLHNRRVKEVAMWRGKLWEKFAK